MRHSPLSLKIVTLLFFLFGLFPTTNLVGALVARQQIKTADFAGLLLLLTAFGLWRRYASFRTLALVILTVQILLAASRLVLLFVFFDQTNLQLTLMNRVLLTLPGWAGFLLGAVDVVLLGWQITVLNRENVRLAFDTP